MSRPATSACATATPGGGAAYSSFASTSCAATATTSTPARIANPGRCGAGSGPISAKAKRYPASSMWTCTTSGGTVAGTSVRYSNHSPPTSSSAATAGWVSTASGRERSSRPRARARSRDRARSANVTGAAVTSSTGASIPRSRWPATCSRRSWAPSESTTAPADAATTPPSQSAVRRAGHTVALPRAAATYAAAAAASAATSSSASTSAAGPWWVTSAAGRPGS